MKEIWKDVEGYEGYYQVSSKGRVKSLKRKWRTCDKLLNPTIYDKDYPRVGLTRNNKRESYRVHVLMAIVFLGHTTNRKTVIVDHINNIKTDNRLKNLQVITQRENSSKDRVGYTSKFIGVSWSKYHSKWNAKIRINSKQTHLGYFKYELEASKAYQKALKKLNK